jgi:hypothetical protein
LASTWKSIASLRNIRVESDFFATNILNNPNKAESHRFASENSEDALTWNVFVGILARRQLHKLYEWFTGEAAPSDRVKLYLWGLRVEPRISEASPYERSSHLVRSGNARCWLEDVDVEAGRKAEAARGRRGTRRRLRLSHCVALTRFTTCQLSDPTLSLPSPLRAQFQFNTWEALYAGVVRDDPTLADVGDYMRGKSAFLRRAFELA